MKRILVSDGMDKGAFEQLGNLGFEAIEEHFEPEELKNEIKNYDAVIVRSALK